MVTKAGKGEHHYLGVDAVRWYVNKQGNILFRKMASGTVKLRLGKEKYAAGLGRYRLGGGAYTAPVFNKIILPNRAYQGGHLTIRTYVRVIKSDTLLSKLLKDLSRASVVMIAGAIGAATVSGPLPLLLEAGTNFTGGIEDILKKGERGVTIFDPGGLQVTLRKSELKGRNTYLLVYRGAELDGQRLKLRKTIKKGMTVYYKGKLLLDGAWILYRLRRENLYGYSRPWKMEAKRLRGELKDLISKWEKVFKTQEEASKALDNRKRNQPNLTSRVLDVCNQIRSDYVLTEKEMDYQIQLLLDQLKAARDAIK